MSTGTVVSTVTRWPIPTGPSNSVFAVAGQVSITCTGCRDGARSLYRRSATSGGQEQKTSTGSAARPRIFASS
jgi:hypothetical protein